LIAFGLTFSLFIMSWMFSPVQETKHPILKSIIEKFESYYTRLPQQKVYLHLDKFRYSADETLWFKAYLVDATNHQPDNSTTNLYVELINPSGYIVQSKLIRMTGGFGNGDFSFQDTIPEGGYKIRAFTNWMRNFDKSFFFEKNIYIANPDFKTYVTSEEIHKIKKENRKNQKKESRYDIQFLPEGGHLLSGVENRVGFKSINELGHGLKVTGEIVDSKGTRIVDLNSSDLGMGSVIFTPVYREKYTALINTGEGKPHKIKLPEAIEFGVNISVIRPKEGTIRIKLLSNFPEGQLPANTSYFLIGHLRGKILFSHEFDLKNQDNSLDVASSAFPTGILHLTLFNVHSQPVSERLTFINNHDQLKIQIEPEKAIVSAREKITVKLKVSGKTNLPVKGSFSLSISNTEDIKSQESIISNLLLNSDLKGKVETPGYYFTDWNQDKEEQLDNLMLTQGWRRFGWTNLLSDIKVPPKYENEKGILITGRITREFFGIPLRDIKVTLSMLNEFNDVYTTRTHEMGIFRFENVDYQDTLSASIEAVRANGKHNLVIYLDAMPDEKDKDMQYKTDQNLKHRGEKGQYVPPPDPDADDPFREENTRIYRLHDEPSAANVIIIDDKTQNYQNIGQILEGRIPGVNVTGDKVNIRGISSIYGNTEPLFLVNGMPVDAGFALNMSPFDVERIEVLKGPETAIYGSRGANGVIAIYTKRGKFMKKGVLDFKMLGYATPKEYYKPRYEFNADDPFVDDRRTILWIPYITTYPNGETTATFYASDVKGNYIIRLEGISEDGTTGAGVTKFEIK
jgi:TonB-dependent SusC/RagA subfamily outer membrane receptor